jgi:hypothetical protein
MRTLVLVAALGLVAAAAEIRQQPKPPAQASGTARIRGAVVDASTGTPVRRASVRLRAMPASGGTWTTVTDDNGAFEIPGLPAGRFSLTVTKGGYLTLGPGQTAPGDRARPIEAADGSTVDLPPILLPRGGVVTGRILDEYGDAVPEITVQAFRAQYMQGMRRLVSVRSAQTNDIGQYRIYGLQPGTYYVAATSRGADGNPHSIAEPGTEAVRGGGGLAPTFYPGTVAAGDAQRIAVGAATETPGVDFSLRPARLARINGTIVDARGAPANDYVVMLNPARSDGALLGGTTMSPENPGGRFTLSNVAPGEYRLDVRARAAIEAIAQSGGVGQTQSADVPFASVPITVAGEDIDGVVIRLASGHRLSGRVIVEGAEAGASLPASLKVSALPAVGGISATMLAAAAPVASDGTFTVRGVEGRRFVRVAGLPGGWALQSVRAGGLDVTDSGIDVMDGIDGVEIVLTANATRLSVVVTDAAGNLVPAASVIIFPEDRELRTAPHNRYVTTARSGAEGRFEIRGLPAASYLAIALPALEDGEWAEPDHLDRVSAAATRVTLVKGESTTVALRAREY